MTCHLCLEIPENPENCLDIASDVAIQSNIAAILYKYFEFCFNSEPQHGIVCQRCWRDVDMFNRFYMRIEYVHNASIPNEIVFVEKIDERITKQRFDYEADYSKQHFEENIGCDLPAIVRVNHVHGTQLNTKNRKNQKISKSKEANKVRASVERRKPSYKLNYKIQPKTVSNIFNCSMCAVPFLSEYKLYIHAKEVHLVQAFKCIEAKCVESYASQHQLDEHIKQNHSRVNCPHCNKMIKLYYLPLHIKFFHDKDQRIVCDLCGHVSTNNNTYKSHIRLVHEQQERLQCDICKDWSRNKNAMREHMRVRHIQKPETCSICGKMSANKKALMKHKKFHLIEARERFKCTICGRGFRDSTKLKEHSYIHSGISDVYRCNYCEKSFRFASSMYAHRKKAHSPAKFKQEIA